MKALTWLLILLTLTELSYSFRVERVCDAGFKLNKVSKRCEDVNECVTTVDACKPNQVCVNTEGSFMCRDDTSLDSAIQLCPRGSRFNEKHKVCVDINECEDKPCKENEKCINTRGSYLCGRPIQPIQCDAGLEFNLRTRKCEDIDECRSTHNCDDAKNEECVNANGSYYCRCKNGFQRNEETGECEDIDECDAANNCTNQCVNVVGSYRCNCGPGYTQSGTHCVLLDQCLQHHCPRGSVCVNLGDSYTCQCPQGFEFDSTYSNCVDINECETDGAYCDICHNTIGSYECKCKLGNEWSEDLGHCVKINQCGKLNHNCSVSKNEKCVLELNSFACKCIDGYNRNIRTGLCEDVNECVLNMADCVSPKICENTLGGHICKCPAGFVEKEDKCEKQSPQSESDFTCFDGYQFNNNTNECEDIDECAIGTHKCLSNQTCVNHYGTYNCTTNEEIDPRGRSDGSNTTNTMDCAMGFEYNQHSNECEFINECQGEHSCPDSEMCSNSYPGHRCTPIRCAHPYTAHRSRKHACIKKKSDTSRSRPLIIQYSAIGLRNNHSIPNDGFPVLAVNFTDVDCEFTSSLSNDALRNMWSLETQDEHVATLVLRTPMPGPQLIQAMIDCNAWGLIAQRSLVHIYVSENL